MRVVKSMVNLINVLRVENAMAFASMIPGLLCFFIFRFLLTSMSVCKSARGHIRV